MIDVAQPFRAATSGRAEALRYVRWPARSAALQGCYIVWWMMNYGKIQSGPVDVLAGCLAGLKGRVLIIVDAEHIPSIAGLDADGDHNLYLAVKEPGRLADPPGKIPPDRMLRRTAPDFVDRVKVITGGRGFENVLVLSRDPEAVKTALGMASVLGRVHLLVPPASKVAVDLTATVNFKSLQIRGCGR